MERTEPDTLERNYTMPEDSVIIQSWTFQKNVPITTNQNVPLSELGPIQLPTEINSQKENRRLAIEKYKQKVKVLLLEYYRGILMF